MNVNEIKLFKFDVEKETDVETLKLMLEAANKYVSCFEKIAEMHISKIARDLYSKDAELFRQKALAIQERLNNLKLSNF